MGDETAKANVKTAAIAAVAELEEQAASLVASGAAPAEYVGLLMQQKLQADAVRFLAHALPRREAVWWAWMCARSVAGEKVPPLIKASLDATEKWIAQPTDEHRRAAMDAAEKAGKGVPAGGAGLAAFFSGGSLTPPDVPAVPPGEYLAAKAVMGAVIGAAASDGEKAQERFERFVAQGLDVARRVKAWERIQA